MASRWYRQENDREVGPYTFQELVVMLRAEMLDESDRVRLEHGSEWVAVHEVAGLLQAVRGESGGAGHLPPEGSASPQWDLRGPNASSSVSGRSGAWILLAAAGVCGLAVAAAVFLRGRPTAVPAITSPEIRYDFRKRQQDTEGLTIVGSKQYQMPEESGLKIAVPPGKSDGHAGIKVTRKSAGDFEITLGYELLDVPKPAKGHGTGVAMLLEDEAGSGASIQSIRGTDDRRIYVAHHFRPDAEGKAKHITRTFPATAEAGWLRITRQDSTVTYWVAEGNPDDFRQLHSVEFTAEPVRIQAYAQPGGGPNAVTLRLDDLVIRAEATLRRGQAPPPSRPAWVMWSLIGVSAAIPCVVGLVWWRKRGRRSSTLDELG